MPWNLADAARRYEAGESLAQIAQALDTPQTTVYKRLLAGGLPPRETGPWGAQRRGTRNYARERAHHDALAPEKQRPPYHLLSTQLPHPQHALVGWPAILTFLHRPLQLTRPNGRPLSRRQVLRWHRAQGFPLVTGNLNRYAAHTSPDHRVPAGHQSRPAKRDGRQDPADRDSDVRGQGTAAGRGDAAGRRVRAGVPCLLVRLPAAPLGPSGAASAVGSGHAGARGVGPGVGHRGLLWIARSPTPAGDPSSTGARRRSAACDWQVVAGRGPRSRNPHIPRGRNTPRRGELTVARERLPPRGPGRMVRGRRAPATAGRGDPRALCGRCCPRLCSGGRRASSGGGAA